MAKRKVRKQPDGLWRNRSTSVPRSWSEQYRFLFERRSCLCQIILSAIHYLFSLTLTVLLLQFEGLILFVLSSAQEKVSALENQANQLSLQSSQECERLAKDRTLTLQMLQKVRIYLHERSVILQRSCISYSSENDDVQL